MTFIEQHQNLIDEFVNGNDPYVSGELLQALMMEVGECSSPYVVLEEELSSVLYDMLAEAQTEEDMFE